MAASSSWFLLSKSLGSNLLHCDMVLMERTKCKNISCSPFQVQDLILLQLSWWIKGWQDPFPYNSNEISRNPSCLRWEAVRTTSFAPQSLTYWLPQPQHTFKRNVDASMDPIKNHAAIGGVLPDYKGNFKCVFSSPFPFMEINNAEGLAIRRALNISFECERTRDMKFVIESDSKNAVNWCNSENDGPWNHNFILNYICRSKISGSVVSILHKGRGSNGVTDAMAKRGLQRTDEFLAWL